MDQHQKKLRRFGKRIRELRKAQDWSQEHFADVAGLDRSYMGAVERGEQNPTFKNLSRIAVALQMTMSELFEEI
jgi:transcriptional regulator with XRE-family HTH domain